MKTLMLNILLMVLIGQVNAQHKPETEEKIKSKKIAYLTDALKLTPDEAQKFWPIYNQKEEEHKELRKQIRDIQKEKKIEDMTDAEAEKMLEQIMAIKQKELDTEKKYLAKFKEVVSLKKVALLHKAEMEFRRQMVKEIREHKHSQQQNKRDEKK